ncbi:MAG: hypothetical protein WC867_02475 [Candidatus Pacearchaeota archaeon]|jgi:hypothetical protein
MTYKQANIFLYQENIEPADKKIPSCETRFGVQLVLDDVLETESHFMWSGTLNLDREKARDYGQAVGRRMQEKGFHEYTLHLNEEYRGKECIPERHSDVWALIGAFEDSVKRNL